VNYIWPQNSQ